MSKTIGVVWFHGQLYWKLLPGRKIAEYTLLGIDSGNVRRIETSIDGTQSGGKVVSALMAAPRAIRRLKSIKETIDLGAYVA
jgi:hypothetical protein